MLIVWLVAVALPLQGFAAATMAACEPGDRAGSTHSAEHGVKAALDSHSAVPTAHHHHDMAVDGGSDLDHQPVSSKAQTSKCSLCASCCTAAAIPSISLAFAPVSLPDFFAPLATVGAPPFLTTGQERPPRPFLA
jgi:hypothetical protein